MSMRLRTVTASAALVLCATTAAVACSSSDATDDARPTGTTSSSPTPVEDVTGDIETGKPRKHGPTDCATSADRISPECAVPALGEYPNGNER
jgi:hypothetical protein